MAITEVRPERDAATVAETTRLESSQTSALENVVFSGDHKVIGRLFMGTALVSFCLDWALAGMSNLQIATGGTIFDDDIAVRAWLNHPLSLMLCAAIPFLIGLAIYLVPLQIGASTIAFPRTAALSFWTWLLGALLFGAAFIGDGAYGGSRETLARLGNLSIGVMAIAISMAAMCIAVTVLSLRAAGQTVARIPHFSFSALVFASALVTTMPAIVAAVGFWHIRRPSTGDLLDGAYPAISWLTGQPAVFIAAIPVLGIIIDVLSAATGTRFRSAGIIQFSIGLFGFCALGMWAATEIARESVVWIVMSLIIPLPVVSVLGTAAFAVRYGTTRINGGVIASLVALLILFFATIGAALRGLDVIGDGSLIGFANGGFYQGGPGMEPGVFYLVMSAALIGGLAGLFGWGSRIVGGGLNPSLGMAVAGLGILGLLAGDAHLIAGMIDADADAAEIFTLVSAFGAFALSLAALVGVVSLVTALRMGGDADTGRGYGLTLEWATNSPPVPNNFADPLPVVTSAYPLADSDGGS